jgi:hypothetical protein
MSKDLHDLGTNVDRSGLGAVLMRVFVFVLRVVAKIKKGKTDD